MRLLVCAALTALALALVTGCAGPDRNWAADEERFRANLAESQAEVPPRVADANAKQPETCEEHARALLAAADRFSAALAQERVEPPPTHDGLAAAAVVEGPRSIANQVLLQQQHTEDRNLDAQRFDLATRRQRLNVMYARAQIELQSCTDASLLSAEAARAAKEERARFAAIRHDPKAPEPGATRIESRVICEREQGAWSTRRVGADPKRPDAADEQVVCAVGGLLVFACEAKAGEMKLPACTTYFEGADLATWRERLVGKLGPPGSESVSGDGFRVFAWPAKGVVLTMYDRGVSVMANGP